MVRLGMDDLDPCGFIRSFKETFIGLSDTRIEKSGAKVNAYVAESRQVLFRNLGLRSDIKFINSDSFFAYGTNNLTFYSPGIFVDVDLQEIDEEAFNFMVLHELGHIKHNDALKYVFVNAIKVLNLLFWNILYAAGFVIFKYVLRYKIEFSEIIGIPYLDNFGNFISRRLEKNADRFAIEHSTDEEKYGGIRFFIAAKIVLAQFIVLTTDIYDFDGDMPQNSSHPTNSYRIEQLKCAFKDEASRNIELECKQIQKIVEHILAGCLRDGALPSLDECKAKKLLDLSARERIEVLFSDEYIKRQYKNLV